MATSATMVSPKPRPTTQAEWRKALADLPEVPAGGKIPSFYFAHGQPMLLWPPSLPPPGMGLDIQAPNGPLVKFLKDFGPALLEKYKPKGIVVFSAHWETNHEQLVTDYGDENPLLMDYFGFDREMYELKFQSRGDSALSNKVVDSLKKAGIFARTSPRTEARGEDGRGFSGPGLDHGVFVPFILMFGEKFLDVPIVQVSIDGSLNPDKEWALGKAVDELRSQGILILSGGLTIHTFRDISALAEKTARAPYKDFSRAITEAAEVESPEERRAALIALTKHSAFRLAHPRAEHFVPIYIAAGAGEQGQVRVLSALYGAHTIAFGV